MEQRLKLEEQVREERKELFTLRAEIEVLSRKLDSKYMVRLGPFGGNIVSQRESVCIRNESFL